MMKIDIFLLEIYVLMNDKQLLTTTRRWSAEWRVLNLLNNSEEHKGRTSV